MKFDLKTEGFHLDQWNTAKVMLPFDGLLDGMSCLASMSVTLIKKKSRFYLYRCEITYQPFNGLAQTISAQGYQPDEAASNAIGHLMKELNDQGLYSLKEAG